MREEPDLVVGGGRTADGRCIVPILRVSSICTERAAAITLTPIALLVAEGEREHLIPLPDAPQEIEDLLERLRDNIEREKEKCRV